METQLKFMNRIAKIVTEVSAITGIDEIHAKAMEELLKAAFNEYCLEREEYYIEEYHNAMNRARNSAYDDGFDDGYDVGYDNGYSDSHSAVQWHTNGSMKIVLDYTD